MDARLQGCTPAWMQAVEPGLEQAAEGVEPRQEQAAEVVERRLPAPCGRARIRRYLARCRAA